MPTPLVLAIDLGTSSTRTALFDVEARRQPATTAQQTYPLLTAADGTAELEPGALLGALRTCLAETLARRRMDPLLRGREIGAISVSCFWHSLVGTNAKGEAVTRVITWADSRCRDDAARLRRDRDEEKVHAKTGCMLRASFWPAKLAWLWRTDERLFHRVHQWMSPAEWLQLQLAGEANCAIGMATGTGLFDPSALAWEPSMLRLVKLAPEKLRPLSDEPTAVGGALGAQFPELRGVPWFPAIGDGAASNLGSGATRPGLAAINVGTSAALRVMRASAAGEAVSAPMGLFCYRVDARRYLVGGAVSNAGNLRAWCMRELKLTEGPEIETALAARPGPQHGLTVLPFWTAERAPLWNEDDLGAIHGLQQSTTALEILQAITEASYHRIARIHELLSAREKSAPKLIVSGGIQKSASSLLRLANVLGQSLYASDEPEASIRGAAVLALERLGFPVPEVKLAHPVKPQIKLAREYKEQRERQRELEGKLAKFGV
jgi:gluconokinase